MNKNIIIFPDISKEEIEDKNGRDALSKTIATLQLIWFVLQIAARSRQHLAITELELTTAALAILNIGMYVSWWKKPTDISCPTIIQFKAPPIFNSDNWTFGDNEKDSIATYYWSELVDSVVHALETMTTALRSTGETVTSYLAAVMRSIPSYFSNIIGNLKAKKAPNGSNWRYYGSILTSIPKFMFAGASWISWIFIHIFQVLVYYPLVAILAIKTSRTGNAAAQKSDGSYETTNLHYKNVADLSGISTTRFLFQKDSLNIRLSMDVVFATEIVDSAPFFCVSAFSGMVFGMIHCLAWDFDSPSQIERLLWRVSSLGLVGLCFFMLLVGLIYSLKCFTFLRIHDYYFIGFGVRVASSFFYVCSRLLLLSLSFSSLRALPDSALDTVQWSLFIPHI